MSWKIHPIIDLKAYRATWDRLNAAGPNSPVLESEFVFPLVDHFGRGDEVIAVHGDAESADAVALMTPAGKGGWQTFQPSQAPIGAWISTTLAGTAELVKSLQSHLPGLALTVGITQRDPDLEARPESGGHLYVADYMETARVTVPESFDAYWKTRGKNLRKTMNRQRNKLEREGVTPRFETLTDPAAMASAVADYGALESAGWKNEGGTAIHPDNAQGRYYRAILESFAKRGCARVLRYFYNDALVATDFCIEGDGTLVILKTTYDESISETSPAHLMRQDAFREWFDGQSVRVVEYYGKVLAWHTKWSDEIRTMYHVTYDRWPVLRKLKSKLRPEPVAD